MKATIGNYEIDHPEGFDTLDDAVKFVQSNFPELDESLIRKNVKSLVNGSNKSNNSTEKSENGDKPNATIRERGTGRKPSGKD